MLTTLVILPTHRSNGNLASVVTQILGATTSEVEVLIVDQGPPRGAAALDLLVSTEQRVHVLRRRQADPGRGSGAAYFDGFTWALQHEYDVVVEMAADGSHLPGHLPRLLDAVQDFDLVIGSRWIPGARVERWTRPRRIFSRSGNRFARWVLGFEVRDSTSGYRVFRSDVLRTLRIDSVATEEHCFRIDMLRRVIAAGCSVAELPIILIERGQGRTAIRLRSVFATLLQVTRWGLEQRLHRLRRDVSDDFDLKRLAL